MYKIFYCSDTQLFKENYVKLAIIAFLWIYTCWSSAVEIVWFDHFLNRTNWSFFYTPLHFSILMYLSQKHVFACFVVCISKVVQFYFILWCQCIFCIVLLVCKVFDQRCTWTLVIVSQGFHNMYSHKRTILKVLIYLLN